MTLLIPLLFPVTGIHSIDIVRHLSQQLYYSLNCIRMKICFAKQTIMQRLQFVLGYNPTVSNIFYVFQFRIGQGIRSLYYLSYPKNQEIYILNIRVRLKFFDSVEATNCLECYGLCSYNKLSFCTLHAIFSFSLFSLKL